MADTFIYIIHSVQLAASTRTGTTHSILHTTPL